MIGINPIGISIGRRSGSTTPSIDYSLLKYNSDILAEYDHLQGVDSSVLYDISGNNKNGTLGAGAAAPTWGADGTTFAGAQYIDLPNLTAAAAPCTIFYARNQTDFASEWQWWLHFANTDVAIQRDPSSLQKIAIGTSVLYGVLHSAEWVTIALKFDNPNLTVYKNGVYWFKGTITKNVELSYISLGRPYGAGVFYFKGVLGYGLYYNAALTDQQVLDTSRFINNTLKNRGITGLPINAKTQVVCQGDSLTMGYPYANEYSYPAQLSTQNNQIATINWSFTGLTMAAINTDWASYVDAAYQSATVDKSIVIIWAGTNDITLGGKTGAETYTELTNYITARKATGLKVITITMLPRTDCTGGLETQRLAYNTAIRGNAGGVDAVLDIVADSRFQDASNVTYFADGIHLTQLGYSKLAELLLPVIAAV